MACNITTLLPEWILWVKLSEWWVNVVEMQTIMIIMFMMHFKLSVNIKEIKS